MPAQENSLDDLITQMMANRTALLGKQEEQTARADDEAGLVPDDDDDGAADAADSDDDGAADAADSDDESDNNDHSPE